MVGLRAAVLLSCLSLGQSVRLNRRKLNHIASTLGVGNPAPLDTIFLEVEPAADLTLAQSAAESFAASPSDLESGDFEINCRTTCGFAKSRSDDLGMSLGGGAALEAAEALAEAQDKLKAAQQALMAAPGDAVLQTKEIELQGEVQGKVQALQAAAGLQSRAQGGGNLENTAVALGAAKKMLATAEAKYATEPTKELEAAIDLQKAQAVKLEAILNQEKTPDKKLDANIAKMQDRLESLKTALSAKPEDPALKDEIAAVERQLEEKAKENSSFSPKASCSRVCVEHDHGSTEGCMRMCVKVMRHLVYNMMDSDS